MLKTKKNRKIKVNEKQTLNYMEECQQYGSVLGLENIKELLIRLGNPQDKLNFVHIAGTNGKGSILAFVSTILKCNGYKVGRYISPTVFSYYEKIQINEKPITKTAFCRLVTKMKEVMDQMLLEGIPHPTIFEIETALSFLYFTEQKCDIVVLETGLGGRLDATNIIKNTMVSVLTSISMDHMTFLGNTLLEIAENKCGIIKENSYVVTGNQTEQVLRLINENALLKSSQLFVANEKEVTNVKSKLNKQIFSYKKYRNLQISLNGRHQINNAIIAIEVIEALKKCGYHLSEQNIIKGFASTKWLGRLSVIGEKPLFLIDGAHNDDASKKVAEAIEFYFKNKKMIFIFGILKDKEYDKIIQNVVPYPEHMITVTPPNNQRAMNGYDLAKAIEPYHSSITVADSLQEAVEISYLLAEKDTVIIAFGSLTFLGEITNIVKERHYIKRDFHGR